MTEYESRVRQAWRQVVQRAREIRLAVPDEEQVDFDLRKDGKIHRLATAHLVLFDVVGRINGTTDNQG